MVNVRGKTFAARLTRYGRGNHSRSHSNNSNHSTRRRNRTNRLNRNAANHGELTAHSSVNDTLFFYKWLFFGDISREALKKRMEAAGLLRDPTNNNNNAKQFSNLFTINSNDRVSIGRIEEALKLQHEDARFFPTPYRLIAALKNYVLYGDDYVHWNDVLSQHHCVAGKTDCFTLAKSRDYVPEGQEYMIVKELPPYMKASTELELRPRVLSNASLESLKVEEVSPKVRKLKSH